MTTALMETKVLKRGVRYRVTDPTTLEVAAAGLIDRVVKRSKMQRGNKN